MTSPQDFESMLNELQTLVETLEKGGLSLEESLAQYERGVALSRQCQKALKDAEQRVLQLTQTAEGEALLPFQNEDAL